MLEALLADGAVADADVARSLRDDLIEDAAHLRMTLTQRNTVAGAETRTEGLGGIHMAHVGRQIAGVTEAFGLSQAPTGAQLYDLGKLPPLSERLVKV